MALIGSSGNGLPPEKVAVLEELNEAFGGNRQMVADYIARFGWSKVVAPNLRIVRRHFAELEERRKARGQTEESDEGRDPYYFIDLNCPFCSCTFPGAALRAKSLVLVFNYRTPHHPLLVPEVKGAMGTYRQCDSLCRSVVVCPGCFYAAPHTGFFSHADASAVAADTDRLGRLGVKRMENLRNTMEADRQARAEKAKAFARPALCEQKAERFPAAALFSWQLAARCTEILAETEHELFITAAEAHLCAAKVAADMKHEAHERAELTAAAATLQHAYEFGSGSALPMYLLAVVNWHLDNLKESRLWTLRVLTDRDQKSGAFKFKRFSENLLEELKKAGAEEAES